MSGKYSKQQLQKNALKFFNKSKKLYSNKFDYSLMEYNGYYENIILICDIHGEIKITPARHLHSKFGCILCGKKDAGISRRKLTQEQFIEQSKIIHNNFYTYENTKFETLRAKVIITCPIHKDFEQPAINHLNGHNCRKCGINTWHNKLRKSVEKFIEQANKIHKNKYDYSLVDYKSTHEEVIIICPIHKEFEQKPCNHIVGYGCGLCTNNISKEEILWLNMLNIPNDKQHRQAKLRINGITYRLDGFDPITNTIYEFYGDYWHGNPSVYDLGDTNKIRNKTYGDLYNETLQREQILKDAGYTLFTIWEHNWNLIQKAKTPIEVFLAL